ncbi:hypothetical protein ABZ357_27395 [Streptomyces sp. NPDC005917]
MDFCLGTHFCLGAPHVDRDAENYRFWRDEETQDQPEWKRFGIRVSTGSD